MPGTPPVTPYYTSPRYANTDPADFSTDVNGAIDVFDQKLGVRRDDLVAVTADYTAVLGDQVVVSGAHTVTLPAGVDQGSVTVLALSGDVAVARAGADTFTVWAVSGLTSVTVKARTVQRFRYKSGVWFCTQSTQLAGGDLSGTVDSLVIVPNAVTTAKIADGAVTASKLDPGAFTAQYLPGDLIVTAAAARAGAVLCDGSSYLRTDPTYAALYAAIGTGYGTVDGTHFNVPDYRDRVVVGAGAAPGLTARTRGQTGGEDNHALVRAENAPHNHGGATVSGGPQTGTQSANHAHSGQTGGRSNGHTHPSLSNGYAIIGTAAGASLASWAPQAGHTPCIMTNGPIAQGGTGGEDSDHSHGFGTSVENAVHTHTVPDLAISSDGSGTPHNNWPPFAVANVFIKL